LSPYLEWVDNLGRGVSVETEKYKYRIDCLRETGARPILKEWVTDIRDQCLRARVPFFFKQWGGVQKKRAGRTLEGRTWDEMPRKLGLVSV
jgi:protein gp37